MGGYFLLVIHGYHARIQLDHSEANYQSSPSDTSSQINQNHSNHQNYKKSSNNQSKASCSHCIPPQCAELEMLQILRIIQIIQVKLPQQSKSSKSKLSESSENHCFLLSPQAAQLEMVWGRPTKPIVVFPWLWSKYFSVSAKRIPCTKKHAFLWFCNMYFIDYLVVQPQSAELEMVCDCPTRLIYKSICVAIWFHYLQYPFMIYKMHLRIQNVLIIACLIRMLLRVSSYHLKFNIIIIADPNLLVQIEAHRRGRTRSLSKF